MANDKDFIIDNPVEVSGSINNTIGTITSSDIDLSTGNYFTDTLLDDTTYTISNAGDEQSFQIEVTGVSLTENFWDVSTAVFLQNSGDIGETAPRGVFFKPDGSKMYVVGSTGDRVREFDLSTAWDVSTASFLHNFLVNDTQPMGLTFKPDGSKMYIVGQTGGDVKEYDLSENWNVTTASYTGRRLRVDVAPTSEIFPSGVFFKSDGSKVYVVGRSLETVDEFDLSENWNISTASYLQEFDPDVGGDLLDVFFKPDGTKMYIVAKLNEVIEYDLSTAWSVLTASFVQTFSTVNEETGVTGVFFKPDGTKMYVVGGAQGDDVTEYNLTSIREATITWPSSVQWAFGASPTVSAGAGVDLYTFVTNDSGASYIGLKTTNNLS